MSDVEHSQTTTVEEFEQVKAQTEYKGVLGCANGPKIEGEA
jgi:hypothetical protein